MKINSFLKLKHMAWASGALVAAILVNVVTRSGAKASVQAPSAPVVQVTAVEQKDVPVYGEWIGTLTGQVNADVKAQVTGYLLKRDYKEGSVVHKGEPLFEIDPRPFRAAAGLGPGPRTASGAKGRRGGPCHRARMSTMSKVESCGSSLATAELGHRSRRSLLVRAFSRSGLKFENNQS